MKTISIRELHERTGAWVRKAVELGAITVTERGKPLVRLEAVSHAGAANPFRARRLRPGYARLKGKLGRGSATFPVETYGRRATVEGAFAPAARA
jgi:antitoxin (DNA-binding transcriptional repressor) of toxin-antitoxin stability system